jgi:hypothetical protein
MGLGHTEGGEGSDDVCGSRRRRGERTERRGRGRRGRGWRRVDGREERIERGRGGKWYNHCASTHLHCVVSVPLPARLTDAVVDAHVDLRIELQSEDVERGEWVALLTPFILSPPASTDGAVDLWHAKVAGSGRSRHSQWRSKVGRRTDSVSMDEEFRGAPNQVMLRVLLR